MSLGGKSARKRKLSVADDDLQPRPKRGAENKYAQPPLDEESDVFSDPEMALDCDASPSAGASAKKTRLYFDPKDRILFLHYGCSRVFEGEVTDVERQYAYIQVDVPLQRIPNSKTQHIDDQQTQHADDKQTDRKTPRADDKQTDKRAAAAAYANGRRWKRLKIKLDAYRAFEDYELISLFRPAFFQMAAPPGFYLNHSATDLWLELDDVFEIVEQGGHVEGEATSETYNPTVFIARVTSVNEISCRIVPTNAPTPPPNKNISEQANQSTDLLASIKSASGSVPEWVPRNTLRFRRFITRSQLRNQSLHFMLVPSTTAPKLPP